ncbi:MAG: glycosyltransferase [Acidobacteriota bacterium]|nr:glycosyltransferase [Acidobacteriota bacterium]
MAALGRTLIGRGHRVTVFQDAGFETAATAAGLEFRGIQTGHAQTLQEAVDHLAGLRGLQSLKFAVECSRRWTETFCRFGPALVEQAGIDCILADQNEPAGGTVAQHLELPFVSVCPSLPLNREASIPPPFVGWQFGNSASARLRNRAGYFMSDRLIAPINATLNRFRREWGLKPVRRPDDTFSPVGQLCQLPRELDFPRSELPETFHYLGPFQDEASAPYEFPFDRLNGRPLVFASLGTLQSSNTELFRNIARACGKAGAQVVIATGRQDPKELGDLGAHAIAVRYAPQIALFARASLAITHAGLNTVLQALASGVPLLAVPQTHDQPAIAARVRYSGAGLVIRAGRVTEARLSAAVQDLLETPKYRDHAARLQRSIAAAGGVERAAGLVEQALRSCTSA